jgi:hypothetical protein
MIKANDLRLENWVYVVDEESTPKKKPVQVNLTWLQIPEALEPIPLTPELLEKAGFEWMHTNNEDGDEREWLQHNIFDWLKYYEGHIHVDEYCIAHIHYLHQLQNLYYLLTGKELEINLHGLES